MRLLGRVELATLRVRVLGAPVRYSASPSMHPDLPLVLADTARRIGDFAARGELDRMSGWALAKQLHFALGRCDWASLRRPWRGLDALRLVDACSEVSGVEVWLDGEPLPGEPYHCHRRMRLRDRMAELAVPT